MRRFSLSVLLVAICLLPVGIGSGSSAHSHAVAALDGGLANTVRAQAQVLEDDFSRAQSIDLLTANNPAFRALLPHLGGLPGRDPRRRAGPGRGQRGPRLPGAPVPRQHR
jgi:C4-dicarboxylate-specific signal transduction histidine kinase